MPATLAKMSWPLPSIPHTHSHTHATHPTASLGTTDCLTRGLANYFTIFVAILFSIYFSQQLFDVGRRFF